MFSRLGFSGRTSGGNPAQPFAVWHLEVTPGTGSSPPTAAYKRLVDMKRPSEAQFNAQVVLVDRYADLRGDRTAEILSQAGGALDYFASVAYLRPDRTRWTMELLKAALRLANYVEMRFKHALACRRPNELSPQIQPMILTPGHGALPSGHATEAFITALVLWQLLRAAATPTPPATTPPPETVQYADVSWGTQLMRLAARVAINRQVAGVHFPLDSAAGAVLGLTLGQYLVNRCSGAPNYRAFRFDGTQFPAGTAPPNDGDFYWEALYDVTAAAQTTTAYAIARGTQTLNPANQSAVLTWLWNKAKAEWS
jgi:membrane-associated phospholipid phosphatase